MFRVLGHQLATKGQWILAGGVSQLINKTFQIQGILVKVHAPPEARADMRVVHGVVHQQVRHRIPESHIALGVQPLVHHRIALVTHRLGHGVGHDRLAGDAHMQGLDIAFIVHGCAQTTLSHRVETALQHVLFPRPHQFDWRVGNLFGDQGGLPYIVCGRAAAKAAADAHGVDFAHVLG